MNEQSEPGEVPPQIVSADAAPASVSDAVAPPPVSYWLKKFFACNPFYLVSAALLLFGCYQISADANFPGKEIAQLIFNFTSLQFYEVLLVVTAVFLARRRIWYDSTLLVGLENLLVFVPFILISQAALIGKPVVSAMCAAGAVIAVARFGGVKRFFAELNLPKRSLGIGAVLLALNVVLPVVYRILHESKWGTKPDWGAAYHTNRCAWLLILPAALAMANFLPHAREQGSLLPQRRWLPGGLFALWFLGTGVHLYCLGYVYDFDLHHEMLAPVLWVLAWTAWRRGGDLLGLPEGRFGNARLVLPLPATLLAASALDNKIFLALALLNVALYGALAFTQRGSRFVRHLLFASALLLVAGIPAEWTYRFAPQFDREHAIAAGVAVYLLLCAIGSRNSIVGFLGSVAATLGVLALGKDIPGAVHWSLQAGVAFLLLHSLRWDEAQDRDASAARRLVAGGWLLHSVVWLQFGGAFWMPGVGALVVIAGYVAIQFFRGQWDRLIVPATAAVVLLSGPGNALVGKLYATSAGVLTVAGSFLLFAIGTIAALTKHRWHRAEEG